MKPEEVKLSSFDQRRISELATNILCNVQEYGSSGSRLIENDLREAFGLGFTADFRGEAEQRHPLPDALSENKEFQVGDVVTWESQARGVLTRKTGVVAEVVPAKKMPSKDKFPSFYKRPALIGLSRSEKSYVVLVGNKPYRPVASKLKRA
jgi:hypothetical protein